MQNFLRRINRLFCTVIHLKPIQIWGRAAFSLKRRFLRVPEVSEIATEAALRKNKLKPKLQNISFTFLSETRTYPVDQIEWSPLTSKNTPVKLWRYVLNYFDWICEEPFVSNVETAEYLILDWIARCKDDHGEPWEPYPLSRRLMAWIRWFDKNEVFLEEDFAELLTRSVKAQFRRLKLDFEIHLQANHLLINYLAAVDVLLWLGIKDRNKSKYHERLLVKYIKILIREIERQILQDGAHEERSPMYHLEILAAINETACLLRNFITRSGGKYDAVQPFCRRLSNVIEEKIVPKMCEWSALLTHPDGKTAQFHDAVPIENAQHSTSFADDFDIWLPHSGYFISSKNGGRTYLALCAHPPSPAHQPGHSHCDVGSFELSFDGSRLIVDTGTGSYQNTEIRKLCRSTAAHNTAFIEGSEQSDMWGSFRVGCRTSIVSAELCKNGFTLIWKDMNKNEFLRKITCNDNEIEISDRVLKRETVGNFVSLLHLAPQMKPSLNTPTQIFYKEKLFCELVTRAMVNIDSTVYYHDFGVCEPNFCLRLISGDTDEIFFKLVTR